MFTEVLVLLSTLLLLIYIFKWFRSARGLPPGPPRYPLVGSLPSLMGSRLIQKTLLKMAKRYGDLFTVYLPLKPTVVINSYKIAREALVNQKDTFSGRPYLFATHILSRGGKGVIFSDFSPTLVINRKIVHSAIRMYQPHLKGKIMEEAEDLSKRLQNHDSQPFDPKMDLTLASVNVIYSILFGTKHLDVSDTEFVDHVQYTNELVILLAPMHILNMFPWLFHFPIHSSKMVKDSLNKRAVTRDARYYKIKETFQENQIRHLLDALLQAKLDEERSDVTANNTMGDVEVMAASDSIFGAGTETTTTTLHWLIAYLLNFPHIQEKLDAEIKEVFGSNGKVESQKRRSCHFLEATLTEVLRCTPVTPIFMHKTTRDTTLSGYRIPKNTTVLLNIWAINHDEREWENPEEFKPDRFLDSEGHFTGTLKMSYIPFGAGRRECIGEALAKTELFLISATLLQKFKFENPPGCPPPDLQEGILGITYSPKPYKVVAKER